VTASDHFAGKVAFTMRLGVDTSAPAGIRSADSRLATGSAIRLDADTSLR